MEQSRLDSIRQWFDDYTKTYCDIDPDGLKNILLKIEHTHNVCDVTELLAVGERLSPDETRIAGTVAMLHDVGRFPQYHRWRTFRDSDSDNHARLAIEVIREQGVLNGLDADERLLIEEAVRFHNLLHLPEQVQSPTRLFIRLIRDADKLDIWRLSLEEYALPPQDRASAVCLGLPDLAEFSTSCLEALAKKQIVQLENCQCINDFKLLQISWALDLNFSTSYRMLLERGYIQRLTASLLGKHEDVDLSVLEIMAETELRARNHGDKTAIP